MQILCSLPVRVARRLRNRLTPALLRASTTAASVRQSVRQSFYYHSSTSSGTDKLKHHPRPAALGTVALLGHVKSSVTTGMQAARGEGMRLRRQMSTIYANFEQGQSRFWHNNKSRLNQAI
ncbi:hypothetical protein BGZ63DRAFT_399304 [Mariannaea sp. PMI_226]|nr:hypothetical protein BGZ63DRAFT_399304 [Mariannaea sp. PMI_226]